MCTLVRPLLRVVLLAFKSIALMSEMPCQAQIVVHLNHAHVIRDGSQYAKSSQNVHLK